MTDALLLHTASMPGGFMCRGEWRHAKEDPSWREWHCVCGHVAGCPIADQGKWANCWKCGNRLVFDETKAPFGGRRDLYG